MYLRILLTIAFTLLTLGCGPKLESNTTTTGQSVAKTYKWKMVTTWPKNFPRPWHRTRALRQERRSDESGSTRGKSLRRGRACSCA